MNDGSQGSVSRRKWLLRNAGIGLLATAVQAAKGDNPERKRLKITSVAFDVRRNALSLWWRDPSGRPLKSFEALQKQIEGNGRKLVFAMNAGMYEADFSPVGLFVANGKEERPLNTRDGTGNFYLKPNGVFFLTSTGVGIRATAEMSAFKEPLVLATQSGPLLVKGGAIHAGFNPQSTSRLIRNGVGVPDGHTAVFAIAEEPLTFHEFATYFRDVLKCPDALCLDGTISSLFTASPPRRTVRADLGPMFAVTAAA